MGWNDSNSEQDSKQLPPVYERVNEYVDPEYTPLVTSARFLAVAEGQFGLKPPPA